VIMPGMSGRALVEEIRRRQPQLPALYLSGHSGDTIARRGVLKEGIELLPKPFTPQMLLARVRSVLDAR
jgi:two-component system cell cycle sensor histidine kinase/response regulator CckA